MAYRNVSKIAIAIVSGCLFSAIVSAQQENTLTQQEKNDGWQLLFNGKNLDGWHSYMEHAPGKDWTVQDGAIMLKKSKSDPSKDYADLVTNQQFANFDLKLEWKAKPCIDSGVMLYVHESPKYKNTYETGPEMQIADLACTVPDSRALLRRAADLYGLIPVKFEWVKPAGEWNQYEIIANQGHLQFFQNGHEEIDTQLWNNAWREMVAHSKFTKMPGFGTFHVGHISLQGTEDKGNSKIKIYFRNIKIRKL
ncbi:MAG: 3-keto-disaccharide hydrolase [Bryobacteraceae bacterium]